MKLSTRLAFAIATTAVVASVARAGDVPRLALVGDPIMAGYFQPLAKMLGDSHEVKSFCANGATVFRGVYRSAHSRYEARNALAWKPDIVLFGFGANAGKPGNWRMKARYANDYKLLVAPFMKMTPRPKIYICLPPPCAKDAWGIRAQLVNEEIAPAVRKIAEELKLPVIDTHTPLKGKAGLHGDDGVFLSPLGYKAAAAVCYKALTGKESPLAPELKDAAPEPKSDPAAVAVDKPLDGWKDRPSPATVELTPDVILDTKGDGPDGTANTDDDTWGFWLQLAHDPDAFARLGPHTRTLSAAQRAGGIRGKVRGPIAGALPNPADTHGWIFGTDWDGRFEGIWADTKAKQVLMAPYVEKHFHGAVAVTYRVPATGRYVISGKVTDTAVVPGIASLDGVTVWVQVAAPKTKAVMLAKIGPVGDGGKGNKRPNTVEFETDKTTIGGGRWIRFVIHPNANWGTDTTRIDYFKIRRVD